MSTAAFHGPDYLAINAARIAHVDSLGLLKPGMTVLEVGAGIGDHTKYLLSKGCLVTATDARVDNLNILAKTYPQASVTSLNLDNPPASFGRLFDVIYCYGTLYHLEHPSEAIAFMARHGQILMLETCVSPGSSGCIKWTDEDCCDPTQSVCGKGCLPSRQWLLDALGLHYPFVCTTRTQPRHKDFPTDWTKPSVEFPRAVFVASYVPLYNAQLVAGLPDTQEAL